MDERLTRRSWLALAALALLGLFEAAALHRGTRFNAALSAHDLEAAAAFGHAHGRFAAAFDLQRRGEFDATVAAYNAVGAPPPPALARDVRFNLANLYVTRALELGHVDGAADDLTVPLIELAKHHYRELLRQRADDPDARYNLELALLLLPDVPELEPDEEAMPERSPRAITPKQAYERLP